MTSRPDEMAAHPTTGLLGAVLVGGLSRRMGRDKALIEIDAVSMARRVANAMTGAGIRRTVAIGPARLAAGLDVVDDRHPGEGPLGAILTALDAAAGHATLVAACDLPWLDSASLRALIDASAQNDTAHVFVGHTDRIEPLCALWRPAGRGRLESAFAAGERAVHRAMADLAVIEVPMRRGALINVNTPDDLRIE